MVHYKFRARMPLKINIQTMLFLTLIILLLILTYTIPQAYTKIDYYTVLLRTVGFYSIIGFSLTLLVAAGETDLSFGSVIAFTLYLFAEVFKFSGNAWLAMLIALFTGAALGLLNGIITTRFKLPSLLVTLGTMLAWRGAVFLLTQGYDIQLREIRNTLFYAFFGGDVFGIPVQFIWSCILFVIFYLILNYHKLGNWITCTGDNQEAARNMGIPVNETKIICFTLVGLVSAFSGILVVTNIGYYFPLIGSEDVYLFPILTAVFMGGTPVTGGAGSLTGTLISTFMINVILSSLIALGFTGFYTSLMLGLIFVIILAINYKLVTLRKR